MNFQSSASLPSDSIFMFCVFDLLFDILGVLYSNDVKYATLDVF